MAKNKKDNQPIPCHDILLSVIENASEGIVYQKADGRIVLWNHFAEKIFGIKAADAIGQTSLSVQWQTYREDGTLFPGNEHPSMITLTTGKPCRNVVMKIVRANHTFSWVNVNTNPVFIGKVKKPAAVVITFSDITQQKEAEEKLTEEQMKINSIFRSAPVGVGLVKDRVIIEVNQAFCNMIGYKREELIGKNSQIIYPSKAEYERVGEEKYRMMKKKGVGYIETRIKCKDGTLKDILLSSSPIDKDNYSKGVTFTVLVC